MKEVIAQFPSTGWVLLTAMSIFVGSFVQTTVGLGLGLVAVPVVGLVAPEFLPEALVLAAVPLMATMLWQERRVAGLTRMGWLVLGRAVGVPPALVILGAASVRTLQMLVGGITLAAVAAAVFVRRPIPVTPSTQLGMGVVSGFTGTATGIGGAPVALLYSSERPPSIRSALALVMLVGAGFSIGGYLLEGRIDALDLAFAAMAIGPIAAGYALGRVLRGSIPKQAFKTGVFVVVSLMAAVLIARAI